MVRDIPSLNAIRFFECAARHLSFTRAGEELFVTQSAVSRQIRLLEEELGYPLFVRSGPNLKLTTHGKDFLQTVVNALDIIRQGTATLRRNNVSALYVSVLPSFASFWLVPRFPLLHAVEPDLSIELESSFVLVDFSVRTDIDAAIRYGRGGWPNLYCRQLTRDRAFPVCTPQVAEGIKSVQDLMATTLLINDIIVDEWILWFGKLGLPYKPTNARRCNDTVTQIQLALNGQGVSLCHEELISEQLQSGSLVRLFDYDYQSELHYYFVCPENRIHEDKIRRFHDWLFSVAGV